MTSDNTEIPEYVVTYIDNFEGGEEGYTVFNCLSDAEAEAVSLSKDVTTDCIRISRVIARVDDVPTIVKVGGEEGRPPMNEVEVFAASVMAGAKEDGGVLWVTKMGVTPEEALGKAVLCLLERDDMEPGGIRHIYLANTMIGKDVK
jgi:hypothetical protein